VEPGSIPVAVVLVSPRNPLNIGAVARAMSNFGVDDLRLVNAYEVAFREARSAVGADAVLQSARSYPSLPDAVADCGGIFGATGVNHRVLTVPLHRLEVAAADIRASAAKVRTALVFGSEKYGLSREDISCCQQLLHIPTRPEHDSMNLGQAVAVCLYEIVRQHAAELSPKRTPRPASAGMLATLQSQLFALLAHTGYVKRPTAESSSRKLQQMLNRLRLSGKDATLLVGMVRQIRLALDKRSIHDRAKAEWSDYPLDHPSD
jgi:TrmH family RNA methyltransferase